MIITLNNSETRPDYSTCYRDLKNITTAITGNLLCGFFVLGFFSTKKTRSELSVLMALVMPNYNFF